MWIWIAHLVLKFDHFPADFYYYFASFSVIPVEFFIYKHMKCAHTAYNFSQKQLSFFLGICQLENSPVFKTEFFDIWDSFWARFFSATDTAEVWCQHTEQTGVFATMKGLPAWIWGRKTADCMIGFFWGGNFRSFFVPGSTPAHTYFQLWDPN